MADFFTGEEFYEKGEDARLELSPDDVRCMNEIIKACGNAISRQWLMKCVNEGWIKFDTEKDRNRFIHLVRDIAPPVTPQPKRRHWGKDGECPFCGYLRQWNDDNFCGHCGAWLEHQESGERND